jgi:transposase
VETLRKVWVQNFFYDERGGVRWRTSEEGIPRSAGCISSPIDPDCRYARKSTASWVGYRVHLTETCEEGLPSIVTDVQTAPAPVADGDATPSSTKLSRRKVCSPKRSS